jgi:hypothetical protein
MANRRRPGHGAACLRVALAWLALLYIAACASGGGAWRDGRFTHTKLGGSLGDLAALEPGWSPERSPDATLAFRHADGSRASWLRECRAVEAKPKALGRGLWIALPGGAIEESSPRDVAGLAAWQFSGRAQAGALGLRVATITRVAKRCEDHWMLVVPEGEPLHRESFDAWVSGFVDAEPAR